MLGKLKEKAGASALAVALEPLLGAQLEKLTQLPPSVVQDDDNFRKRFVSPAVLSLGAASGGLTALVPGFTQRIDTLLFRLRDELVVENNGKLALIDGYQSRLPELLRSGLSGK